MAAQRRLDATTRHVLYSGPIVDPHHHFLEPERFASQHTVLGDALASNAAPGTSAALPKFAPEDYKQQFMDEAGLKVVSSVYMEVIADDFVEEVRYVEGLAAASRWTWAVSAPPPAAPVCRLPCTSEG